MSYYVLVCRRFDQVHDEIRPAAARLPGVEDLGDIQVVHQGQCLPFRLEAGDNLTGVHPRLEDFERYHTANRLLLLGHEDDAEAAFADLLQELVGADNGARALGDRVIDGGGHLQRGSGRLQEAACSFVPGEQSVHLLAQVQVTAAHRIQVCGTLGGLVLFKGREEQLLHVVEFGTHRRPLDGFAMGVSAFRGLIVSRTMKEICNFQGDDGVFISCRSHARAKFQCR
jgi:hypothetical protein